mmetsp:Transcript_85595/g.134504  ORF Transcript_85595/g.134504 Transcript_85595/m.134504 type:complete len:327 (-) Transcript_85595:69-1049(-)
MHSIFGGKEETKALLRHGAKSLSQDCDDALLWSCDVARCKSQGVSRSYEAMVPWDVLLSLVLIGCCGAFGMLIPFLMLRSIYGSWVPVPSPIKELLPEIAWCGIPCMLAFFALVVGQIPTRIIREPDAIIVELLTSRHVIPLEEVLELVVLNSSRGARFSDLLTRWKIFPFGMNAHCFRGVPSMNGVVCVLLTRQCFWSFTFCLKDPVPFLLDNQKPLEPGRRYRTAHKVLVRQGVELTSPKAAIVQRGHWLRIEKQMGRRAFVRFEDSEVHGWMSYISSQGHFLLAKDREAGAQGLVGASEFRRSYGGSGIELKDFVVPEGDIIE